MSRVRQKILVVIGTRPEAIKMAPVIHALKARPECRTIVCLTGQHREMIEHQLPGLRIRADHELKLMRPNQDLHELTERILHQLGAVLKKERPDWVLVQGDSTTAMAASLAAFFAGVHIGHVEAGLRTRDEHDPFPEEVNRRIADTLAAMHFAPTAQARSNLLDEGVVPESIEVTGNPVIDVLLQLVKRTDPVSPVLAGLPFSTKRIIVFTVHRRESFGKPLQRICAAVRQIAESATNVHIACMVHRNPAVDTVLRSSLGNTKNLSMLPPLPYRDFVQLLNRSYLVMTDSGGLQEECPSLGKPLIVLREKTERTETVDAGASVMAGRDRNAIIEIADRLLADETLYRRMARVRHIYGDGTAAERIVARLLR
jgi:UDP-N-acetylglucosamine 2-epimerase (non-hydrolysing)